jgi:hypothetical protein
VLLLRDRRQSAGVELSVSIFHNLLSGNGLQNKSLHFMYRIDPYWYNERMLAGLISPLGVDERHRQHVSCFGTRRNLIILPCIQMFRPLD